MAIHALHLISYLLAVAFLLAWLVYGSRGFYGWVQKAGVTRRLCGKKFVSNPPEQGLPWQEFVLAVSGACLGWAIISAVGDRLEKTWLLFCLCGLGVLSHELRPSKQELNGLSVMALIAGLREQSQGGTDLFERLARVVEGLPAGVVQKAVREALQQRRSGFAVERCYRVLQGLHPLLDELVHTLRCSGWQAGPAFDLALERLGVRAGRQWERTSPALLFKEKIRPWRQFGQAFICTSLVVLVMDGRPAWMLAWPISVVMAWIGLGCAGIAGILYAGFTRAWLNRFLGTVILAASLVALVQFASPPRLADIQIQEVTHVSQDASPLVVQTETFHAVTPEATGADTSFGNQKRQVSWPNPQ